MWSSLVVRQVEDQTSSLLWLWLILWRGFNQEAPHASSITKKKKRREREKKSALNAFLNKVDLPLIHDLEL